MKPFRYTDGERVIRVDPDSINPFTEVDDNPRLYSNQPAKGRLPGFGEKYDTCGEKEVHFCSDCGRPITNKSGEYAEIGRTCWNKDCPRCAAGWAMRRSYKITSKIEDYRKNVSSRRGGKSPKFHHVVIVAPYDPKKGESTFGTATENPLNTFYQLAKVILEQFGVMGGVRVYHPYSGTSEDDLGAWKERLFQGRDWMGDVREEVDYRPHMHCIVVSDYIDYSMVEAIYEQTGCIVNRITKKDSDVSLYGKKDLAGASTYSLSHAGVGEEIEKTYRYFGAVAQHTATEATEEQMKGIVRQVVPHTLGINLGQVTCDRPVSIESGEEAGSYVPKGQTADGDGNGTQGDSDTPKTKPCGGRLVPIEYGEDFLGDVQSDLALRRALEATEPAVSADD